MMNYHEPVLREKIIDLLQITDEGIYVDCTVGGGGHFNSMIKRLHEGLCIGIDVDQDAIEHNTNALLQQEFIRINEMDDILIFKRGDCYAALAHNNYKYLDQILTEVTTMLGYTKTKASGILFDLGVSSYQIDEPEKGFSYMQNGPLDMRMDKRLGVSAADLVNGMYEKELEQILREYGEEVFAKRIARGIIAARKEKPITTTRGLCDAIKRSIPFYYKNPYAKTFQALRIAVNSEMEGIEQAVKAVDTSLAINGRVAWLSFHSLEDKIIKRHFVQNGKYREIGEMQMADKEEVDRNKRARSAKLRCFEKVLN